MHFKKDHQQEIKCKLCKNSFEKYSDLEIHIKAKHETYRKYECEPCGKTFALRWRLRKHLAIHTSSNTKKCHYFNNKKSCPYEEIGCMFEHILSEMCKYGKSCSKKLCSYQHELDDTSNDENDMSDHVNDENDLENEVIDEFEKDDRNILALKEKTGLDMKILVDVKNCSKCEFETHSEGQLRKHNRYTHMVIEPNTNIIFGFKKDIQEYFKIFKEMGVGEEIGEIDCQICNFKTKSNGEMKMHEQEMH